MGKIDGHSYGKNQTTHQGRVLTNDVPTALEVAVHKGGVRVTADGATLIDWEGSSEQITHEDGPNSPARPAVVVGTGANCSCRFSKLQMTSLDKAAVPLAVDVPSEPQGAAIPDAETHAKTLEIVRELFRQEYTAAKTSPRKAELAAKLLERADDSMGDAVARYVLLDEVRRLGLEIGDAEKTLAAVDALAR